MKRKRQAFIKVVTILMLFTIFLVFFSSCSSARKDLPERRKTGTSETFDRRKRDTQPSSSGLKAGFADDNKQFNYFINFLTQFKNQVRHCPIDVQERIILKIKDMNGRTIPNAKVSIYANNNPVCDGTTYADGSFLFFPSEYDQNLSDFKVVISYMQHNQEIEIDRWGQRQIDIGFSFQRSAMENVPLDILFILDTTGSMGEEINRLKKTIEIINLNLASLSSKPKIRFGMVLYKDKGDEYVTRVVPPTDHLNDFQKALNEVEAEGGGDTPEDLQSALWDVLKKIEWNKNGIRLSFIITDAPPHLDYGQEYTYVNAASEARREGIKIFSVGTGGLDLMGEYILRQISQYTYAKYIFLTYGEKGESEGGKPGSVSHHTGANFQTDKLEAIIIRFTKEELNYIADQPVEDVDDYFQAVKLSDEEKDETLQQLFSMAISQLVDYSSLNLPMGTPAGVLPITTTDSSQFVNAEYFTEQLALAASKNKTFTIVERVNFQEILKELQLQMSGLVDEENAAQVGKLIGAEILITGRLYAGNEDCQLFLKLLRVETGEILAITKSRIDMNLGLYKK